MQKLTQKIAQQPQMRQEIDNGNKIKAKLQSKRKDFEMEKKRKEDKINALRAKVAKAEQDIATTEEELTSLRKNYTADLKETKKHRD